MIYVNLEPMCPSFFALCNKAGIACAADADHTIYRLADKLPVAIAVNPQSPIPWERIIGEYRRTKHEECDAFIGYVSGFGRFMSSLDVKGSWEELTKETSKIIFFGYGAEDIYPSVCTAVVDVNDSGALVFCDVKTHHVARCHSAFFHFLGNFDNVSPLLFGISCKNREFFLDRHVAQIEEYSRRVIERFKGTEYEEYVSSCLADFDAESKVSKIIYGATEKTFQELSTGVDGLSMEEMVTSVESIINANAKLTYLRSMSKGERAEVKEIAVMTLAEGLTWIKHGIYMRRTEI